MIAAGVITGLLLLIHAHTFLTVMGVAACLAILRDDWRAWSVLFGLGAVVAFIAYRWEQFRALVGYYPNSGWLPRVLLFGAGAVLAAGACLALLSFLRDAVRKKEWPWREWAVFFAAALLLAVPQMLWVMSGSSVEAKSFIGLHFGWDKDEEANVVVFWLSNTGLFIPLLIATLLWSGKEQTFERRRLFFYLPFTLCFIGPNLVKLAPWPWDNIKVLFYWYVASVPLVALVLTRLWQSKWPLKILMTAMLLSLTLSGALDVWRISSQQINQREYERDGMLLAEKIVQLTPPRALILHAPTYNQVVFLTGRRSLLGYAGQVWSRGLEYAPRERDIKNIYAGAYSAENLLAKHKVDYIVVTPVEREYLSVDDAFFARYPLIAEVGAYRLYQVKRP